jgi:hypothetical protein
MNGRRLCSGAFKRHRDVMFLKNPDLAPISMIITNLGAHAYAGETDLWEALSNIVEKMPQFIRASKPRVPNPADPAEDYADKWEKNPALAENFWLWYRAVKTDMAKLPSVLRSGKLAARIWPVFRVALTEDEVRDLEHRSTPAVPTILKAPPPLVIPSAPRPWGPW